MNSPRCCCREPAAAEELRPPSPLRRFRHATAWIVPGAIVVAMPKCPMCVAGYLALATGVGISFSTAAYLRLLVLALCLAALAFLAARRVAALLSKRSWLQEPSGARKTKPPPSPIPPASLVD